MKDIYLGRMFGYEVVLKDVPKERHKHIEKLAVNHLDKMQKSYVDGMFNDVNLEIETAKSLRIK